MKKLTRQLLASALLGASLVLTACGTTNTKTTTNTFTPAANAKTLLVKPDVELKILMASGMTETRADWSRSAEENLANALSSALQARGGQVDIMDLNTELSPRQVQLVKLNDAVVSTSLQYDYYSSNLPTREDVFDRSIGPGAAELGGDSGADYALMVKAAGSYSSAGKVAMNIAMLALGGGVQIGGQQLYASLVDLETGDIVWSNLASAAVDADMREADGAARLVDSVLKDFPL